MIQSFRCPRTEALYTNGDCPAPWMAIRRVVLRKLDMLNAAESLTDLKVPPGNRLEKLSGDRNGQWSIRINDQWRLCFEWSASGPQGVEVVDYH